MYRLAALVATVAVGVIALQAAAGSEDGPHPRGAADKPYLRCPIRAAANGPPGFTDVTEATGLDRPLRGMFAHAVAWGDVNGDARPDLYVGGFADYPLARYRRRGAHGPAPDRLLLGGRHGFRMARGFPRMLGRSSGAVFADLDGDRDRDLVIARDTIRGARRADAPSEVLAGDGHGGFARAAILPRSLSGRAVAVLDYDGDRRPDLFVTDDHYRGGTSMLLKNRGHLRFEDVTARVGLAGVQGFGAAAADLDGDGRPDLVVAGTRPTYKRAVSPAARIFLSRPGGKFIEAPNADFAVTTYDISDDMTGVAVGDLNRDGRPDIALGPHFESTEQYCHSVSPPVYLNAGGARFHRAHGLPGVRAKSAHVEIEDMDADGRPDLLTSAPAGGGPAVFGSRGGANPRFRAPAGLGRGGRWGTAASADFDSDGRQDVFLASFDPARPSLLLRNRGPQAGRVIEVEAPELGTRVEVYRAGHLGDSSALIGDGQVTAGTGYGAGVVARARVGVGRASRVDIRVRPPRGGAVLDRRGVSVSVARPWVASP